MTRPGSTTARGYGWKDHAKIRKQVWEPKVARGIVPCVFCQYVIRKGEPWDLDHNEDRTGHRGPAHARCNRAEGGRIARAREAARKRAIRRW